MLHLRYLLIVSIICILVVQSEQRSRTKRPDLPPGVSRRRSGCPGGCAVNAVCYDGKCRCKEGYKGNGTNCAVYIKPTPRPGHSCPEGWTMYNARAKCVKVFLDKRLSWWKARKSCQHEGGDLVKIPNNDMMEFVQGLGCPKRCWIGLHEKQAGRRWKWLNEEAKASFSFWSPGEPKKSCVVVFGDKKSHWNDNKCGKKRNYICQLDA